MISAVVFVPSNDVENSFDQLAALTKFVVKMYMLQTEFWTTSRIIVLGGSISMLQEVYQHFQSIFGICFTAQMASFQEQIMELRGGTECSRHVLLPLILCFRSFLKCYKSRKLLSEWEFYKMKVAFSTKKKIVDCNQVSSELSMTCQIVKEFIV